MDTKHIAQNKFINYKNIAFIVIAILILIVRKSDSLFNPQLWAEDGVVFFAQQYEFGASSIFTAYADYIHIVPRLIAVFADSFFSYANIPAVYNYTSLFITILVIAHCFSPRLQLPFKPLLALSIVLVPQALNEVFLNITNLQWILCILLVLTLLKDAPNIKYGNYTLQVISDFIIIIFAGLTGPFLIVIFPFFAWKLFRIKKAYGYTLLMTALCIVFIQLFYMIPNVEIVQEGSMFNLDIYISIFGRKLFGGLFFGRSMMKSNALLISSSALAFFTILLYLSYKKSPENMQILKIVLMFLSISVIILGVAIARYNFSPFVMTISSGCRYFYVPYVMVAWSLVLCINQHGIWKNIFVITALILIPYSSILIGFQTRMTDYNWKYHSSLIGTKSVVTIPINPHWSITIHNKNK
ncbi:MAG: hypothetical protein ABR936_14445 [Bacteroidota bacterium]